MTQDDILKLPMDVDIIIDVANQPDPDAHKKRRYQAGVAYGRTTVAQENYLIFMVKADVSIGDAGATIHSIDRDKTARSLFIKGVDGYEWADEYAAQLSCAKIDTLPAMHRDSIAELFKVAVPSGDTLPAHRVHYVNADMTNPDHRPHR